MAKYFPKNHYEEIIDKLRFDRSYMNEISNDIKRDPYFWIAFVIYTPYGLSSLYEVPNFIIQNGIFFKELKKHILSLENYDFNFYSLIDVFKNDKDIILKALKKVNTPEGIISLYDEISDEQKKDFEIIETMILVLTKERTLENFPRVSSFFKTLEKEKNPFLKNPRIKEFIINNTSTGFVSQLLDHVDPSILKDSDFMLSLIEIDHNFFLWTDPSLLANRDFQIKAIKKNPLLKTEVTFPMDVRTDPEVENLGEKIIIIKTPSVPMYLSFQNNTTLEEILKFKTIFKNTVKLIKTSKVPNFRKALIGEIIIGDVDFLKRNYDFSSSEKALGAYSTIEKRIYYYKDRSDPSEKLTLILIHELGHKLHNIAIKKGMDNQKIIDLWQTKETTCELPKIGDPLSNLREDWWSVKMSSENEFFLSEIVAGQGFGSQDTYIYVNDIGEEKKFNKKQILKLLNCPSEYGATDLSEWFAEMCVLITLNKVKPSQKLIANEFIKILEEETT
jgi:hypothetical protein